MNASRFQVGQGHTTIKQQRPNLNLVCLTLTLMLVLTLILSEKAMATHSSTLAWKIPWMKEPGRLQSPWGCEESDTAERLHFHFSLSCIGEGNGNAFQCSCLKTPRDGGAWWAAIYGVTQSRRRLKRLSSSNSSSTLILYCILQKVF